MTKEQIFDRDFETATDLRCANGGGCSVCMAEFLEVRRDLRGIDIDRMERGVK